MFLFVFQDDESCLSKPNFSTPSKDSSNRSRVQRPESSLPEFEFCCILDARFDIISGFSFATINSSAATDIFKVALVQGNTAKINNTVSNKRFAAHYQDGNLPVEVSSYISTYCGISATTAFAGGKFEMIKAHFPLNSATGKYNTTHPLNTVTGTGVPVATLGNGASYSQPVENQVMQQALSLNGPDWSSDAP